MATVKEHYNELLADYYSWLYGGFDKKTKENYAFFEKHHIRPKENHTAVDLGSGSGFQTIPLAQMGFKVTAIDISQQLLDELSCNIKDMDITCVNDDLTKIKEHISEPLGLAVCMGDTLTHLQSKGEVETLFENVYNQLDKDGRFVLSFRDLTYEFKDLDRFLPVNSDDNVIFTCFLEYEGERIKIHDLIYAKEGHHWVFKKSYYYKVRLSCEWTMEALKMAGFSIDYTNEDKGMITIIAVKE